MADPRSLIDTYPVYIDGQWVEPENGRYDDISPATEAVIASAPDPSPAQVDSAIAAARAAFDSGPGTDAGPEQREQRLVDEQQLQHAGRYQHRQDGQRSVRLRKQLHLHAGGRQPGTE